MAGRSLKPVTDRCLGRPLPYQLANPTQAHLIAQGLAVPCFHPWIVCGISPVFTGLSPTTRYIPTRFSPVRHSTQGLPLFRVRLACVRHAASVQSEPGSNSPIKNWRSIFQEQNFKVVTTRFLAVSKPPPVFHEDLALTKAPTQIT